MNSTLTGQMAFVSGASRGIGAAIADAFAARGAAVIGTATSEAGAAEISARLAQNGATGRGLVMNVTDSAQVEAAIAAANNEFGPISILVNNAGITRDNLALRMKEDEWDQVIETNLSAVFRVTQMVLKTMLKARHGRIITISSVVGALGNAGQVNYAAAKAGVVGFTKSLAREVGSRNVTVNCVAPGFIETDMTHALKDEQRNALLAQIPLGRLGSVADIAAAVCFLASPEAAYITGTTLHVNGGMYMI